MSDAAILGPRANWLCLGKKCDRPEGGIPFEASVKAQRCPECGSKRIKRLYDQVNIGRKSPDDRRDWRTTSSNKGTRQDVLLEPSFRQHEQTRVQSADIHSFEVGNTEREVTLPGGKKFVRPSRTQLAEMFGVGGKGREMTPLESGRMARSDPYSVPALINKPAHRRALERHTQIVKEG